MRTQEEIDRQIEGLKDSRSNMPEFDVFGTDNYSAIDAQIAILEGVDYEDYEDEDYSIESAAYHAQDWLNCDEDDDLF